MSDCEEIVGQFPSPLLILQFSTTIREAIKQTVLSNVKLVTEDEMGGMKWLDQKKNSGTIDTYMDTYEHSINVQFP